MVFRAASDCCDLSGLQMPIDESALWQLVPAAAGDGVRVLCSSGCVCRTGVLRLVVLVTRRVSLQSWPSKADVERLSAVYR
jgi:hypothetical protein